MTLNVNIQILIASPYFRKSLTIKNIRKSKSLSFEINSKTQHFPIIQRIDFRPSAIRKNLNSESKCVLFVPCNKFRNNHCFCLHFQIQNKHYSHFFCLLIDFFQSVLIINSNMAPNSSIPLGPGFMYQLHPIHMLPRVGTKCA